MSPAKSKIEILTSALIDIDQIANYHMEVVGPLSAEKITDSLLDSIIGYSIPHEIILIVLNSYQI